MGNTAVQCMCETHILPISGNPDPRVGSGKLPYAPIRILRGAVITDQELPCCEGLHSDGADRSG